MGQGLSCIDHHDVEFFDFVQKGEIETVREMIEVESNVLELRFGYGRLSALHVAAAHGQIEVLSLLLDRCVPPDILNRHKQTPLMLAAMHGRINCVMKLIQSGANILMFDSVNGRTCLHHAAYYGHSDCLQAILAAAHSTPVANSWGFSRFVNVRDGSGATPLHLAARQRRPECIHILLDNGALVCASTGTFGHPGSTPLHLAARGGSLDCVRELLAWGADRLQLDAFGRIPFSVAFKHKHKACAALLNPSAAEPLIWPAPLKFISELNPEAKALLENALLEANKEREKEILKKTIYYLPSPFECDANSDDDNASEASDMDICCICFDQVCTIEVRQCGHRMCAFCILALCCYKKPNPVTPCPVAPVCPFCRSNITQLVVAQIKTDITEVETCPTSPRRSRKFHSEGSSSCRSLSSLGSFGRIGTRGSGRIAAKCNNEIEKF